MADQTLTINENAAQCIKSATHFTETVYHNICTGAISHVQHGFMDYVLGSLLIAFMVAVILMLLGCLIAMLDSF